MNTDELVALLDADAERAGKAGALAGAATEGPWYVEEMRDGHSRSYIVPDVARWRGYRNSLDFGEDRQTADFVAASRTEAPWLVETLRARDAAIRAFLDRLNEADRWKPYESRDTGPVYLSETVDDLIADLRAALASALGGGEQQ